MTASPVLKFAGVSCYDSGKLARDGHGPGHEGTSPGWHSYTAESEQEGSMQFSSGKHIFYLPVLDDTGHNRRDRRYCPATAGEED